jgi:uncharacterized membrane protein YuzA (DUF378 family)
MFRLNTIDWIVLVLLIVGGVNWGLVGIFDFNLVEVIFGQATFVTKLIYDIVGVAAIYMIISLATRSNDNN